MEKNFKSLLFYFFMNLILLDFGNELKKISFEFNDYTSPFNNPIFSIVHVKNTGCAFSLLEDYTEILAILGIIAIIFIGYYIFKYISFNEKLALVILTLLSSGTLGNMLERLIDGYVMDYIKLKFVDFPVFNAFDIMICLSIFIYLIFIIYDMKRKEGNDNGKA